MKRKLSCLTSIVLVTVLLFAACSPAATTPAPAGTDAPAAAAAPAAPAAEAATGDAQIEIRAAWWGDTVRNDMYNEIVDGFEARYPHIRVVREPAGWADYWDRLAIQTAGGHAPDFISMHALFASDYIGRGVLAPLDPFIADGTIDVSGWQQSVIDTGVVRGTTYMLAMGVTFASIFVNRGLMDDLGIAVPSIDWTWDDFMATAWDVRAAFDARGNERAWMIADLSGTDTVLRFWLRQHNQYFYDVDGNIAFTPEIVEEFWEKFIYMRENNLIPDPYTGVEFGGATLEEGMFSREVVLMANAPVNQFAMQRNTFPDKDMTIIRNPSLPGGPVGEFPEGAHFAVSAFSPPEQQQAAAMLMNYWLNTEESLYIFRLDQGVPGNEPLHSAFIDYLTDDQIAILDYVQYCATFATPFPFHPRGAGEVNSAFGFHAEQVRFGLATPADAAQAFFDEAVEIIRTHQEE